MRSVRPARWKFFFALVLAAATAALAALPARGCVIESFLIYDGLGSNGKATQGQKVTFRVGFQDSSSRAGSIQMDYGDGAAQDSGARNLERALGDSWAYIRLDHIYTKTGTFTAILKGGSIEHQTCGFSGYLGIGLVVGGKPATKVTVAASLLTSTIKQTSAAPQAAVATQKSVAAVFPTSVPAAKNPSQQMAAEKGTMARALVAGQITRASVTASVLGNFLKVEGSGQCGLKAVDAMDGSVLKTYDFKGPLPGTIQLLSTLPGKHAVKIDGDKSSESCGGTASVDYWVVKPKGLQ